MKNTEFKSFIEDGIRYLQCKHCKSEYVQTGKDTVAVTCSTCVAQICLKQMPLEEMIPSLQKKKSSGRPPGWHFMNEFVDKDGNVFHRGKEQPKLKGTLPPTKVTPKKKTKRRTKEQILIARQAEKKAALKKAVKKQKDFINHKFGG